MSLIVFQLLQSSRFFLVGSSLDILAILTNRRICARNAVVTTISTWDILA